jgi:hypothetical protein
MKTIKLKIKIKMICKKKNKKFLNLMFFKKKINLWYKSIKYKIKSKNLMIKKI